MNVEWYLKLVEQYLLGLKPHKERIVSLSHRFFRGKLLGSVCDVCEKDPQLVIPPTRMWKQTGGVRIWNSTGQDSLCSALRIIGPSYR